MPLSDSVRAAIAAARAPSIETGRQWRETGAWRALEEAFADCSDHCADPAEDRAAALLADDDLVGRLVAPLIEALRADPFFEPPVRPSRDPLRTAAVLFEGPTASITASVVDAAALAALPTPATIAFTGKSSVTRYVKAGGATLRRWRAAPLSLDVGAADARRCTPLPPIALVDGELRRCDGRIEAQQLAGAVSDPVLLVATIHAGAGPLVREHATDDGRLVRVASADDRASRTEMLLTWLRLAGRSDAGARFEEATHDRAFHLRWAAMREWLALDAESALPRLAEMADADPAADVRAAATATLAAVRRRLEAASCPG